MSTIDTKHLRALAEAALSRGTWVEEDHSDAIIIQGSEGCAHDGRALAVAEYVYLAEDRAYIAAIDPPTLIALLDELERLRGDAGWEYYATARKGYAAGKPRVHERGAIQAYEEALDQVVFEQEDETPVVFKRRVGPWEPVEGETDD